MRPIEDRYLPTGDHLLWFLNRHCNNTGRELAKKLGLGPSHLGQLIKGQKIPNIRTQRAILQLANEELQSMKSLERTYSGKVQLHLVEWLVNMQSTLQKMIEEYTKNLDK